MYFSMNSPALLAVALLLNTQYIFQHLADNLIIAVIMNFQAGTVGSKLSNPCSQKVVHLHELHGLVGLLLRSWLVLLQHP